MQKVTTGGSEQTANHQQRGSDLNGSDSAELLAEMLKLRSQLDQIANMPAVAQAHQLTAQVALVLEPVWSLVSTSAAANTSGVGYLRRYGSQDPHQEAAAINDAVAERAVRVYGSLNLVAPTTRDVWQALARPAEALWCSVQDNRGRLSEKDKTSERQIASITPTVRPGASVSSAGFLESGF